MGNDTVPHIMPNCSFVSFNSNVPPLPWRIITPTYPREPRGASFFAALVQIVRCFTGRSHSAEGAGFNVVIGNVALNQNLHLPERAQTHQ